MILRKHAAHISSLLDDYSVFSKEKNKGELLTTLSSQDPDQRLICANLKGKLKNKGTLEKAEFQELVWILDFLAQGLPDNFEVGQNEEIHRLSTTIREAYFKEFGENAYSWKVQPLSKSQ